MSQTVTLERTRTARCQRFNVTCPTALHPAGPSSRASKYMLSAKHFALASSDSAFAPPPKMQIPATMAIATLLLMYTYLKSAPLRPILSWVRFQMANAKSVFCSINSYAVKPVSRPNAMTTEFRCTTPGFQLHTSDQPNFLRKRPAWTPSGPIFFGLAHGCYWSLGLRYA